MAGLRLKNEQSKSIFKAKKETTIPALLSKSPKKVNQNQFVKLLVNVYVRFSDILNESYLKATFLQEFLHFGETNEQILDCSE